MNGGGAQEVPPHPKIYWQLMVAAANGATVLRGAGTATVTLCKSPQARHAHTASFQRAVDHKTVHKVIDTKGRFRSELSGRGKMIKEA